jgi:hypothetical protein
LNPHAQRGARRSERRASSGFRHPAITPKHHRQRPARDSNPHLRLDRPASSPIRRTSRHIQLAADAAAPAAGIEPASSRLTAERPYQHGPHRKLTSDGRGGRIRTGGLLVPNQADWPGYPTPLKTDHIARRRDRECPAGVEPALPPWEGGRPPRPLGHRDPRTELSKNDPPEHRAGLEPASPPYESGVLAARRPVPRS